MSSFWGEGASWVLDGTPTPHEAGYLKLDASRARADLGWKPQLRLDTALEYLVRWYRSWQSEADMHAVTLDQIESYSSLLR
jgi:CDP-glucose 4,6-dehydratase